MNKIVHVVGNRPQFIKLAPLYHELNKRNYEQYIFHSGQHYDINLSDVFFQELNIPSPYINLQVGSGSHAEMTARAMIGFEKELIGLQPDLIILYGDTDTTLAGALAAAKLNIPIAHVEGGIRTYSKQNPEECNRIVTDHLSTIIFCSDENSIDNMKKEGLDSISYCTGDIMYDTFLLANSYEDEKENEIVLMTWHRQENTASKERMESIINLLKKINDEIVCPMHPRTIKYLKDFGLWDEIKQIKNLQIIEPVGYFAMVALMKKAKLILTDSGGVSKESSFAGAKCLFFTDLDIWIDLEKAGWITKINPEKTDDIHKAIELITCAERVPINKRPLYYGDGHAAQKMADLIEIKFV